MTLEFFDRIPWVRMSTMDLGSGGVTRLNWYNTYLPTSNIPTTPFALLTSGIKDLSYSLNSKTITTTTTTTTINGLYDL